MRPERDADYEQYDYEYNFMSAYLGTGRKITPIEPKAIANIEVAHYKAVDCFDEIDAKYTTWTYYLDVADYNGRYLMDYLKRNSGGLSTDFVDIQKQILHFIDKGSTVEDFIGENFDFVNDQSKIALKVGSETLRSTKISDTEYGFGVLDNNEYRYRLVYERTPKEKLTLYINEAVTPSAPVNLQYSEKLVKIPTEPGRYEFDTNEKAILKVVDSDGNVRGEKPFPKPKVIYSCKQAEVGNPDIQDGPDGPDQNVPDGPDGPDGPDKKDKIKHGNSTESKGVKTSDSSAIGLFVALLIASMTALIYVYTKKDR